MTNDQKAVLNRIYITARKLKSNSDLAYEEIKRKIRFLRLKPTEYEDAIKEVSQILRY